MTQPTGGKAMKAAGTSKTEWLKADCRMNYRHAYHAGNFADVVKHIALMRVIEHLKQKAKPFRFVDTHAGTGLYDLSTEEAQRTGEWRHGVGALMAPGRIAPADVEPGSALAMWLSPYFDVLREVNGDQLEHASTDTEACSGRDFRYYPGSGELARRLMRPADRMALNELHAADVGVLRRNMARDDRVAVLEIDGWTAVKSLLPPKERRGVLLIDPPFEVAGEFKRLERALADATARFATGVTLMWYPVKAGGAADAFVRGMTEAGYRRLLLVEHLVRHRDQTGGLNGSGLLIHNPPYELDLQLNAILTWLSKRLPRDAGASWRVEWLAGE